MSDVIVQTGTLTYTLEVRITPSGVRYYVGGLEVLKDEYHLALLTFQAEQLTSIAIDLGELVSK